LVVISIIAVLVSILMPSLSRARDLADDAACASNVNAIVKGEMLYASDNNQKVTGEKVPWSRPAGESCPIDVVNWAQPNSYGTLFYELLLDTEAIPSLRVFDDPADSNSDLDEDLAPCSYGFNLYFERGGWDRDLNVHKASWTIMITPNNQWKLPHIGLGYWQHPDAHRHTNYKAAYGFCDGHAEYISFEEMFGIEYDPEMDYDELWSLADPEHSQIYVNGWMSDETAEFFPHWRPWPPAEYNQWGQRQ
ncbi:MAG: hypothetical protein KGY99_10760, partial [Phycisphaerae bacterium]|nr:hypothetical protein [Phycisphaerae bacterium]